MDKVSKSGLLISWISSNRYSPKIPSCFYSSFLLYECCQFSLIQSLPFFDMVQSVTKQNITHICMTKYEVMVISSQYRFPNQSWLQFFYQVGFCERHQHATLYSSWGLQDDAVDHYSSTLWDNLIILYWAFQSFAVYCGVVHVDQHRARQISYWSLRQILFPFWSIRSISWRILHDEMNFFEWYYSVTEKC